MTTPETIRDLVNQFPEINPSNYNDDDISALNAWGIEAAASLEQLLEAVEEAERVIGPVAEAFTKRVDNPKMADARRKWNEKMPGEWPIELTLTMETGRAASAWRVKHEAGR